MRYAVLYSSGTGNTEQVARAIYAALPAGEARLESVGPDTAVPGEEVLFLGFWTDKGVCPPDVQKLLAKLSGKQVALFGTAGFGGSPAYFDAILQRTQALLPAGNTVLGGWMCQGKMPAAVRARYEAMAAKTPGDPKVASFLANFDQALSHPDQADLSAAADFARNMAAKAQG
ncbi:flavodoxin family protein BilS [uncultured Pseudoflavonifractor sp.]|uniref:flavodoxin family protein BilS n=1 Tax=uncultured Pseudoflavonifractor sp. TaxID=1221379 RepID=UPI002600C67E|nr:flavodoxin family protein BilS [uncultured Pseudoflavonifractor sp.]